MSADTSPMLDEEEVVSETLYLLSADKNNKLPCQVVAETEVGNQRYVLLTPEPTLLTIVRDEEDGVVELAPEDFAPLAAKFREALAQSGGQIAIEHNEFVLGGDLNEGYLDNCDELTMSDEDDEETLLILAEVEHEKAKYFALVPEVPGLFAAKVLDNKQAELLTDKELETVGEQLEDALRAVGELN